jgi:cation:H+ antiporter
VWIGLLLLVGGILLVVWGAERFTDGAIGIAVRFGLSAFYVGAVVSGFEPENLVTGGAAALGELPQIALGTVIGSAVFLLTAALGITLLLIPMDVRIPRAGGVAMIVSTLAFSLALWGDGTVSRREGLMLVTLAIGLMAWLYRASPVFTHESTEPGDHNLEANASRVRVLTLLVLGAGVMLAGAELVVHGARVLLASVRLSETFLGMAVVAVGESAEETARMLLPARRGHPDIAWGNVVGTIIVLVTFNLGVIALLRPLTAEPLVLHFHAPYLVACVLLVATALLVRRRLGRVAGGALVALYAVYLAVNLARMWRE